MNQFVIIGFLNRKIIQRITSFINDSYAVNIFIMLIAKTMPLSLIKSLPIKPGTYSKL